LIESKLRATPADFSLLEEEGWLAQVGARFGADEQRIIERAGAIARSELSERTLARHGSTRMIPEPAIADRARPTHAGAR
jgi:hypothetical protein